ncbi:MAG: zinc ABC transporter substrate-binding protein [Verrucomicrobia bacterium]|nr:zinc ABC transporter substrate-binding protein [Verrucomicrobiota bacterium]MCH8511861.1 metal ABC transporter substrate-binding protein [Kiritimatiellia bacterium]
MLFFSSLPNRVLPTVRTWLFSLFLAGCAGILRAEEPRADSRPMVATLHPLLSEMVTRIAGDHVRVEELMGPAGNPHTFDPTPGDLARIQDAALVVAMGKNLETYLDRLKSALPSGTRFYEAGRLVPSLRIDVENEVFMCCPAHSHGAIDPHWWHSPMAMHRAVRHLGRELERLLPDQQSELRANTRNVMDELEDLHEWVKSEISEIPRRQRKLVTAHAAFGYFCEAYNFQSIPVQGLTTERDPTPAYLAETIQIIRRENIRSVFPEKGANPKILETLQQETGVVLADPLLADNTGSRDVTYADMIRNNVNHITAALLKSENN